MRIKAPELTLIYRPPKLRTMSAFQVQEERSIQKITIFSGNQENSKATDCLTIIVTILS